jgi:hypothetical protein
MNSKNADNILPSNGRSADLASEPDSVVLNDPGSKVGKIETYASGGCLSENKIIVRNASGQSTSAIIGTNNPQGWFPSPALWDTIVNFGAGDAVAIWGPNFHFIFGNNQAETGYVGPTLRATASSSLRISVTFADASIAALNEGARVQTFDANPTEGSSHTHFHGMSETSTQYIAVTKTARRITVPYGTALTPRILLSALLKMPTMDIENTIEGLIAELNNRYGDPDDEPESDEASLS